MGGTSFSNILRVNTLDVAPPPVSAFSTEFTGEFGTRLLTALRRVFGKKD